MCLALGGCAARPPSSQAIEYRQLATRYVRKAMEFQESAAVRAQAIEAAGAEGAEFAPLIRKGLRDPHAAVRFAACLEIGKRQDRAALSELRGLLNDPDLSVRVGAYFALERLGDRSHRTEWTHVLLRGADAPARRNAALALGQLGDPAVLPLLQRASVEDRDEGVQIQALEGMAKLGNQKAVQYFIGDAYGGRGYRQPFALLTLGQIKDDRVIPVLRSRLASSPYVEAQLAAARGLGRHGIASGYELALKSLSWDAPRRDLADDLPENQIMRVRTMAAMALGEIGDPRALEPLKNRMQTPDDPRVQLAAAHAILMILDKAGPAVHAGASRESASARPRSLGFQLFPPGGGRQWPRSS